MKISQKFHFFLEISYNIKEKRKEKREGFQNE